MFDNVSMPAFYIEDHNLQFCCANSLEDQNINISIFSKTFSTISFKFHFSVNYSKLCFITP